MSDFYETFRAQIDEAYAAYLEIAGVHAKRWSNDEVAYVVGVHREGFLRTIAEAGIAMVGTPEWKSIVRAPTFAELQPLREDPFRGRCSRPSCHERCSQCIRAAAIDRNRARYGSNGDYPGADAAAAIDRHRGAAA